MAGAVKLGIELSVQTMGCTLAAYAPVVAEVTMGFSE